MAFSIASCSFLEKGDEKSQNSDTSTVQHEHIPGEMVVENVVLPTCESDGHHDEVVYCQDESCHEELSRETVTDKGGHLYGDPSYVWSNDNSSVTATAVCQHDESHILTETVSTVYTIITDAQCETTGEGKYTATFTKDEFTKQEKTVEIAAKGHSYQKVSAKEPSVEEEGNIEYYTCKNCDKIFVYENGEYVETTDAEVVIPKLTQYKAIFMADGEQVGEVVFFTKNDTSITEPDVPEKEGYTGAWEPYTLGEQDLVINAVYTAIEYSITIKRANGTNDVIKFTIEDAAEKLATVALTTNDAQYSYSWKEPLPQELECRDYTFEEVATVNTYTISFKDVNGNLLDSGEFDYGETPEYKGVTPTKASDTSYHYDFAGWSTSTSKDDIVDSLAAVTGDATYYAIFDAVSYAETDLTANKIDFDLSKTSNTFDLSVNGNISALSFGSEGSFVKTGYEYADDKLTINKEVVEAALGTAKYGDLVCNIFTDTNNKYKVAILAVTKILYTKEDLAEVMTLATAGQESVTASTYTAPGKAVGYYVLANDIDFEGGKFGLTHDSKGDGFVGTFDGRGHTISNIETKYELAGLFGKVGATGVIKNVAFVNLINTGNNGGVDTNQMAIRRNFLSFVFYGTVENVYIEATRSYVSGPCSAAIGQWQPGARVSNLVSVINETGSKNTAKANIGSVFGEMQHNAEKGLARNLVGVSKHYAAVGNNGWGNQHETPTNVYSFTSIEAALEADTTYPTSEWDEDIWQLNGPVPAFKGYDWTFNYDKTGEAPYLSVDLSKITSDEFAIDTSKLVGTITEIKSNSTVLSGYNASTGVVSKTFTDAILGSTSIGGRFVLDIKTDDDGVTRNYKVNADLITKVIYTKEDLAEVMTLATAGQDSVTASGYTAPGKAIGYYVLANDVDFEGGKFGLAHDVSGDGFVGTFDGRGHTISNIETKYENAGLFGKVGAAGVIKNVAFVNVINTGNNAGVDTTQRSIRRNFLSFVFYGTVENVYVEGTRSYVAGTCSAAIGQWQPGARVSNLVSVINETGSKNSANSIGSVLGEMQHNAEKGLARNLVGVSKHYAAVGSNGWGNQHQTPTNVYSFASIDAAAEAGTTYSSTEWDTSIWDISGAIPVFK